MPKALFFNVPAHGHVNPSLPLVAELTRRGHQVTYYLTESFRSKIEATGATFQPYRTIHDDYFESRGLNGTRPQKAANLLITTVGEVLPELLEIARTEKPDYILYDGMCPWGYFVARVMGLPAVVSLSLLPLGKPSLKSLLPMLRTLLPMALRDFDKGIEANKRSRALGKQYNIPPLGPAQMLNSPGDLEISYSSSYFTPFADTLPDRVCFVGWTLNTMLNKEPFPFEAINGRQLIYVSLGTIANDNPEFFKACIEAFRSSDAFVVISTGNRIDPASFGTLPENIMICGWVPQIDILKQASLFISHGGLNSVQDGLYLGVPLLLVPQQEEQTFTAMRVVELGAGLMLEKSEVNAQSLREKATRLLTDSSFKTEAVRIGETLQAAGGVKRAVDEIEALLQRTKSRAS